MHNLIQSIGYGLLGLIGESLQIQARLGNRDYSWLQGHLSDFCLSAMLISVGYLISDVLPEKYSKIGKIVSAISIPVALTFHEFYPFLAPEEGVFDPQDIACYFVATLLTYPTDRLVKSKKMRRLIKGINFKKKSKHKSLENIL